VNDPNFTLHQLIKKRGSSVHVLYSLLIIPKLSKEGYFLPRRKWKILTEWVADCERIAELKRHIDGTKRMIEYFRESEPILYNELSKDIEKAVRAYRYASI
jgi:hypothetical protein